MKEPFWHAVRALLTAIAVLVGSAAPGRAEQPFNWTGFYIGGNAGYARTDAAFATAIGGSVYFLPSDITAINSVSSGSDRDYGAIGGVQAGYNWQANNVVVGIEVDAGTFNTQVTRQGNGVYPCCAPMSFTVRDTLSTDRLVTVRSRLGLTSNAVLLYVTGGLALTKVTYTHQFTDTNPAGNALEVASVSDTKTAWTIGGGAEVAFSERWSMKAEYLHLGFGTMEMNGALVAFPTRTFLHATDLSSHIGRLGINFRF